MMSVSSVDAILDTAHGLWAARDELTHDLVDGAFYWRHCRAELIDGLREILDDEKNRPENEPYSLDSYARLASHLYRMQTENPNIESWLEDNLAPGMRAEISTWSSSSRHRLTIPMFEFGYQKKASTGCWFLLGVRDNHWTGPDVERACRAAEAKFESDERNRDRGWLQDARDQETENFALVAMDFTFYNAGELSFRSSWHDIEDQGRARIVRVESPVIMCAIPYPFPTEGVIASIYDAVARRQYGWHRRLYGYQASGLQTVDVAIRTWAIGLLQGVGQKQMDAQRIVYERLGIAGGLPQPQYTVDRQNLLRRVPEAKPYVYSRPHTNSTQQHPS